MSSAVISKCTCKHPGQDEMYGVGNRVLNHAPGGNNNPTNYRCTVCRTAKTIKL